MFVFKFAPPASLSKYCAERAEYILRGGVGAGG